MNSLVRSTVKGASTSYSLSEVCCHALCSFGQMMKVLPYLLDI